MIIMGNFILLWGLSSVLDLHDKFFLILRSSTETIPWAVETLGYLETSFDFFTTTKPTLLFSETSVVELLNPTLETRFSCKLEIGQVFMTHVQKFWSAEDASAKYSEINLDSVKTIKRWVEESSSLPKFTSDEQLILFLHSCYADAEETKKCIQNYYRLRLKVPQFFQNRDVHSENLQKALRVLYYGILPEKTPDGYKIVFHMLNDTNPANYVFNDGFKLLMKTDQWHSVGYDKEVVEGVGVTEPVKLLQQQAKDTKSDNHTMMIDAVYAKEGPQKGLVLLFDLKGVKLGHVTKLPLNSVRRSLEYLQDAIPVRLKAIHVLNVHSIIDKIMMLVKPFLRKKFLELLHFHKENDEEVYKSIPKKCLPRNYGGELDTVDYYHTKFIEEMESLRPLFVQEEALMFGTEGIKIDEKNDTEISLKNLSID